MVRLARRRASSPRPAWTWRAPQHGAASPVGLTPDAGRLQHLLRGAVDVALPARPSRSPVKRWTSSPDARSGSPRSGRSAGRPIRLGIRRSRAATASTAVPARSRRGWRQGRVGEALPPWRDLVAGAASVSRVRSISRPNGTLHGQAGSQPRHCTHVSKLRTTSAVERRVVVLHLPHERRCGPRGDRASSPVTRNVGHGAGTGRTARTCSARRRRCGGPPQRTAGSRPGFSRPVGSNSRFMRSATARGLGGEPGAHLGPVGEHSPDADRRHEPAVAVARRRGAAPPVAATSGGAASGGGPVRLLEPSDPAEPVGLGGDVGPWPSSRTQVVVPSHRTAAGRSTTSGTANGSASALASHSRTRGHGVGPQHDLASRPERAERARRAAWAG